MNKTNKKKAMARLFIHSFIQSVASRGVAGFDLKSKKPFQNFESLKSSDGLSLRTNTSHHHHHFTVPHYDDGGTHHTTHIITKAESVESVSCRIRPSA
jgi:hypothetical protein